MPGMEEYLHTGKSHVAFFQDLYLKKANEHGEYLPVVNKHTATLIDIIVSITRTINRPSILWWRAAICWHKRWLRYKQPPPTPVHQPQYHSPSKILRCLARLPALVPCLPRNPNHLTLRPNGLQWPEKRVRNAIPVKVVQHLCSLNPRPPPNPCNQRRESQPENAALSLNGRVALSTRPS